MLTGIVRCILSIRPADVWGCGWNYGRDLRQGLVTARATAAGPWARARAGLRLGWGKAWAGADMPVPRAWSAAWA